MKKLLDRKIILVMALIIILIVLIIINKKPVPSNYYNKVKTGGNIESKYMDLGKYETSFYEEKAEKSLKKYIIYYPKELEEENKKYPVVIFLNGNKLKTQHNLLRHMASWGFIAVGTEEENDWNGYTADDIINHLKILNSKKKYKNENNIFYNSIDMSLVGIEGYDEGSVGTINALTKTENKDIYKAAVILSPVTKEESEEKEWTYNEKNIDTDILMISEGNKKDLKNIYDNIKENKIMMRRRNTKHNEMLYQSDGYVTAWFMYKLKKDDEASKAFIGDNAEIKNNKLYKDIEKDV